MKIRKTRIKRKTPINLRIKMKMTKKKIQKIKMKKKIKKITKKKKKRMILK